MSLLSVHMSLDGVCGQRKASQSLDDMEKQEGSLATRGRPINLVRATATRQAPTPFLRFSSYEEPQSGVACVFCLDISVHFTSQSGKPEPQSMEATLERKQKLQLGGKKVRLSE